MTGFEFTCSCPRCGGLLRHLTGATTLLGTESTAVTRCQPCRRDWQIVVRLLPVGNAAKTAYQRMNRARHREETVA